ncbi:hypothetical protein MKW98_030951 [Papaver atlanticum]|uniref:WASH complex subunit strumpellin homolog n=1 Tax=Papaver atlanticum TaxID=357466 RepID=A0AAD4X8R6_9MAGN|nr:hypothetical protein MKW98_030951 [Papaver atlanticum]
MDDSEEVSSASTSSNLKRCGEEETTSFPELLNFTCRIETLISQLLLLSSRIPPHFLDARYDPILFDLRFFDSPSEFEAKIDGNKKLEELEDELRESCSEYMQRFFLLVNGIVVYHQQLFEYLQEGNDTLLNVALEDELGRQLITESLALFGCLLLLMEHHMSGYLREKLLVAYLRHKRSFSVGNLESICSLCRVHTVTAFPPVESSVMVSVQKPEELFIRLAFPKQVVGRVISCLKYCDLYNRVRYYPDSEHRSVALASQAGYLYVMLFYSVEMLHDGVAMREIVDRFFKDSLIVPIFMHFTVDLSLSWDVYKGAKSSLSSLLLPSYIGDQSQLHYVKVKDLMCELCSVQLSGMKSSDALLSDSQLLFSLLRSCNVSLRWLLLHRSSADKKTKEIAVSAGTAHEIEEDALLSFLLKMSQVELELKQLYTELIESRRTLWEENKGRTSDSIRQLSEYLFGTQTLLRKIKDGKLMDVFKNLSKHVYSLDYKDIVNSGKKLYHVISSVRDIEQLDELKECSQIKERISIVQKYLQNMLQALNLQDETVATLSVITDAVYLWGFLGKFTRRLHKKIKQASSVVLNLHCLFLKFRPMVDAPIIRLSQNQSPDLPFVSAYYSSEYVAHISAILEIIPVMLFTILSDDVVSTLRPNCLERRTEADNVQNFQKPGSQYRLTKALAQISIISQGIKEISEAPFGLMDLSVKSWIEDKLRKELFKRFKEASKSFLVYRNGGLEELEKNLQKLTTYFLSQLHVMECLQDLMDIQGTRLWEEEFSCFLKHSAQKEYDDFVSRRDKNLAVIVPVEMNEFSNAQTFLGDLLSQILKLTRPSLSMYIEPMSGWFDAEGCELLGMRFFELLYSCVGPVGLASLDSLLVKIITENLKLALKGLKILMDARSLEQIEMLNTALGPPSSLPLLGWSSYQLMAKLPGMLWEPWVESLACIGQLQILRCLINLKLNSACKVKARAVCPALDGIFTLVSSQRDKMLMGNDKENCATTEHFLHELSKQGSLCGFCVPLQTTYLVEDPPHFLGRCASMVTISQLPRYVLNTHLGTLTSHLKTVSLDFSPVVIGLGTFLRQFHPSYLMEYVQYMGQYVRITTETCGANHEHQKGAPDPTSEALKSILWMMFFCKHMEISKDVVDSCIPPSLIAVLQV